MSRKTEAHQQKADPEVRIMSNPLGRRLFHLSEIERIRSQLGRWYADRCAPSRVDPFQKVKYLPKRRLRILHEAFECGI